MNENTGPSLTLASRIVLTFLLLGILGGIAWNFGGREYWQLHGASNHVMTPNDAGVSETADGGAK